MCAICMFEYVMNIYQMWVENIQKLERQAKLCFYTSQYILNCLLSKPNQKLTVEPFCRDALSANTHSPRPPVHTLISQDFANACGA